MVKLSIHVLSGIVKNSIRSSIGYGQEQCDVTCLLRLRGRSCCTCRGSCHRWERVRQ